MLQASSSILRPEQLAPLAKAIVPMSRLRVATPPAQLAEQLDHEPQLVHSQLTGHSTSLQVFVCMPSVELHSLPPSEACMLISRVRFCFPPRQLAEQSPQDFHSPQTQSTASPIALWLLLLVASLSRSRSVSDLMRDLALPYKEEPSSERDASFEEEAAAASSEAAVGCRKTVKITVKHISSMLMLLAEAPRRVAGWRIAAGFAVAVAAAAVLAAALLVVL
mmetsp:Transcript_19070/g.41079  ORF Transcript_19070/g.41079 Transcript_19070/m.41079 type:complete len:221 (+) Transcript_19070:2678-3340(+)